MLVRHNSLTIDYLAIGHICADLQPDGTTRLGGTALFAALTAHALGLSVGIVTACGHDLDLSALPADIAVLRQPSPSTTIFENRYTASGRTQLLHAQASAIDLGLVPDTWRSAPMVHLAPIMQDVPLGTDITAQFPRAVVAATPQGWLRHVHASRLVTTTPALLRELPLSDIDIVVLSEEDVQGEETLVQQLSRRVRIVVLTRAERGASVLHAGQIVEVPAARADVADPTGAGDVFAAAFLAATAEGQDPVGAAYWACAAAAWAIEAPGASGLPTREMVRERLVTRS